jgi:hypothetical protein
MNYGLESESIQTMWNAWENYLIILRSELIQTFLDDVVTVQILDQDYDVKAERKNDRMDLSIVSEISLRSLLARKRDDKKSQTSDLPAFASRGSRSFSERHECRAC